MCESLFTFCLRLLTFIPVFCSSFGFPSRDFFLMFLRCFPWWNILFRLVWEPADLVPPVFRGIFGLIPHFCWVTLFAFRAPILTLGVLQRCVWVVTGHLSLMSASGSFTIVQWAPGRGNGVTTGRRGRFCRFITPGCWITFVRCSKMLVTRTCWESHCCYRWFRDVKLPVTDLNTFPRPIKSFLLQSKRSDRRCKSEFEKCKLVLGQQFFFRLHNVKLYALQGDICIPCFIQCLHFRGGERGLSCTHGTFSPGFSCFPHLVLCPSTGSNACLACRNYLT